MVNDMKLVKYSQGENGVHSMSTWAQSSSKFSLPIVLAMPFLTAYRLPLFGILVYNGTMH